MMTLVPIDGSQSSFEALKYAARSRPNTELLLLYVAPSGREVDLQRGRFLLEDGRRACLTINQGLRVETRLEIGDRRTKLPQVAEDAGADLVVMGAHGVNAMPHVDRVGADASELTGDMHSPVVLVLPTGKGIRAPSHETPLDEEEVLLGTTG